MTLVSLSSRASIHREGAQHLSCFRDIPNSVALPLGFRANVRAKYGNTHVTLLRLPENQATGEPADYIGG